MRVCLITHRKLVDGDAAFMARLAAAIRAGVTRVQVREKDLAGGDLLALTRRVLRLARTLAGDTVEVLVNGRLDVALAAGADGVHLPARGLSPVEVRRIAPPGFIVCVSTHGEDELAAAARAGADDAVFGPVFPTASHPGEPGVGADRLARARARAGLPVWAIGGIEPGNVRSVAAAGVTGVAVIRAVWRADDVEQAVRRLAAPDAGESTPTSSS